MVDRIQAMHVFTRVVEAHSFAKAAETLRMPPSSVTRIIKELETYLGVKLLQRTTRQIGLTPDGSQYYDQCLRLLADIEAVESSFPSRTGRPGGKLRVDMTPSLARLVVLPSVSQFLEMYPDIELTLTLGDRTVDLVQEGVDCVVRAGEPQDSGALVARRIASFQWITCASPDYLERHGEPMDLNELSHHYSVGFVSSQSGRSMGWKFVIDDEERSIQVPERLAVNDTDAYICCGLEGLGLIRAANYMVAPHIRKGRLQRILMNLQAPPVPLSLMFPQNRHLSPTVRAFADWVTDLIHNAEQEWE